MPSPHQRDVDLDHLHPTVREAARWVIQRLNDEGHEFRLFEGFRTPQRQEYLYSQGRTRPGRIVTRARPWNSYHQYGFAVDLVLFINGRWSWETGGASRAAWSRMHELGGERGLVPLSWELPHLQLAEINLAQLKAGHYPADGDRSWAENLEAAIAGWTGSPAAPEAPDLEELLPMRPAIEEAESEDSELDATLLTSDIPPVGQQNWHSRYGGREWRYDGDGVYIRSLHNGTRPLRSPGAPLTCRAIWEAFSVQITTIARRFGIPPELIIMTIGTEAGAYRQQGFTGPATFRWEPHVWNRDVNPPSQGDYSAGPMQTLGTTARWVIGAQSLPFHKFQVAPVYRVRPVPPPVSHPLYDAAVNIEIGTAEIKQRIGITGTDPILIAAAFNSGGVYQTDSNAWHMKSHGNHLDRAAQWYGDACAVLKEVGAR